MCDGDSDYYHFSKSMLLAGVVIFHHSVVEILNLRQLFAINKDGWPGNRISGPRSRFFLDGKT
jgi:hypothetical protein